MIQFTDTDYAVIIDSLSRMRRQLQAEGIATPNVEATIAKFCQWGSPMGCEFAVIPGTHSPLDKSA